MLYINFAKLIKLIFSYGGKSLTILISLNMYTGIIQLKK